MEWLYQFVTESSTINVQIQTWRSPLLDGLFIFLTFFGNEEFYIGGVPIVYWVFHKSFGRKLIYLLAFSLSFNIFLKNLFSLPRPFQADSRVLPLVEQGGYGLPSGHAQHSVIIWGYAAYSWQRWRPWIWGFVALLVMMVTFSRLYLGVHFLADAVVGLILGITLLTLWINYEDSITGWLGQMDHRMRLALGIIVPLLVLFVTPGDITGYPAEDMTTMTGIWIGLNIGFLYESIYVRFLMVGSLWHKLGRYLVGLVFVVACWLGLRILFGLVDLGPVVALVLRIIRYAATTCAGTWWAPAAFVRLGLARQAVE